VIDTWRDAVDEAEAVDAERTVAEARKLREALERINDSRLSRDARVAFEDAREALRELEAAAERENPRALELDDAATRALEALERAVVGSKADEAEGKAIRRARRDAEVLEDRLAGPLPTPREALSPEKRAALEALSREQEALRQRADELMRSEDAKVVPPTGVQAMRDADTGMQRARDALDDIAPRPGLRSELDTISAIQRAIDSLRRSTPPPSSRSFDDEASTEAEQDKSLRDEVIEAMKDGREVRGEVERYYEELLR
jgi:hypothetical protein